MSIKVNKVTWNFSKRLIEKYGWNEILEKDLMNQLNDNIHLFLNGEKSRDKDRSACFIIDSLG